MKKALIALLLLLVPGLAFGQGGMFASDGVSSTALVYGQKVLIAIPGASITVCSIPVTLVNGACTNKVALYSDFGLTAQIPNPTTLDVNSNYSFYAANTVLQYTVTNKGVSSGPYFVRTPGQGSGGGTGTGITLPPYTQFFTGQTTVTVPGSVHGYRTMGLITACYDSASPAHKIEPAQLSVNTLTYDVTVLFASPQSGFCVINGGTSANLTGTLNGTSANFSGSVAASTMLSNGSKLLPISSATQQPSTWQIVPGLYTGVSAEGDSRTAGSDASSTASEYVYQIASDLGISVSSVYAVGGSYSADTTARIFNEYNPGAISSVLQIYGVGVNDAVNNQTQNLAGPPPWVYENNFNNTWMAGAAWMAIPSTLKRTGANTTPATNWSTDTTYSQVTGLKTTTNGATQVFNYTTTVPNQQVFVWYQIINGGGGVAAVQDDGGAGAPSQTIYGYTNPSLVAQTATQSVGVAIMNLPQRSPGAHTITVIDISPTSAGNVVSILGVGISPATLTLGITPTVWASGVGRLLNNQGTSAVQEYDRQIRNDVATLQSNGLAAMYIDINSFTTGEADGSANPEYWNGVGSVPVTCGSGGGYFIHGCNLWHREVANAFEAPTAFTNVVPGAAQSPFFNTNQVVTTGSYFPNCSDQVIYGSGNSNISITMPGSCPIGKSYTFVQLGSGVLTFTSGVLPAIRLAQGQSATVQSYASATSWYASGIDDPSQYNTVSIYSGNTVLGCGAQVVYENSGSASTITAPAGCAAGKTILVKNVGAGVIGFAGGTAGDLNTLMLSPTQSAYMTTSDGSSWWVGPLGANGFTGLGTKLPTASTMAPYLPVCTDASGTLTTVCVPAVLLNCGALTTTAAASDAKACAWVTTSSACTVTPITATSPAWTYLVPSAGSVTVFHAATAISNAYSIACSAN